ncbi:MAG: beta strand repeat-containing protein [Rhodoferax sp.]
MNLVKYIGAFLMLALLSACGGGGGSPGASSGATSVVPLFTSAPASLTLASGTTSANFDISGGVAPYAASPDTPALISVSLNGSAFTIAAAAGNSGSGAVVVTDSKGTKVSIAVTVPSPTAMFSTAPANLTLAIGASSSAYAVSGGTGPYSATSTGPGIVSASIPTGSNFLTITALPGTSGGSANVIVSDTKGAQLTIAVTVSPPAGLFSTAPANLTLAIGASSSAYAVTGGTAPYSVASTNSGLVTASIPTGSNLLTITALPGTSGGGASVIVSDTKGSQLTIAVTVTPPLGLYVDAPANLTIATGAPGNTYTISGGAKPYTAVSSNTAVASSTAPAANGSFVIQGVSAGNASVTIKDAAGTTLTLSVTVPSPTALFSTAPATLQILNGTTNFYTVFGGTAPYVVNTNGVIARAVLSGSSLAISGMVPGVQTVAVSDAKGAVITIDVTVKDGLYTDAPANLSVPSGTGATYSIYGGIPFSGTSLYRVNSSNPAVATAAVTGSTLSISGLSVGSTSLVITDSVGASAAITVTVPVAGALLSTAPSPLKLATGTSGVYAISGGVGPYTATSANPSLVSASASGSTLTIGAVADTLGGTASVVVTDSVGTPPLTIVVTAAEVQFFTTAPSPLAIAAGSSKIFAVFGGSLPYSVVSTHPAVVSGSISGTTLTITGTMAGNGTVIVSDAKGVSVSSFVTVNAPGPLFLSAPGASVTIASGSSNTYDIIGGVPPYLSSSSDLTIARATIVNANQVRVDALGAGKATIAVTDSAGTRVSVDITVPGASSSVLYTTAPSGGVFLASADVVAYAIFGGVPNYSVQSSNENVVHAALTGGGFLLQAIGGGSANVLVRDSSGLSVTIPVTVGSANAFFVAAPGTLNMGAGTVSPTYRVSGGTKPYSASSSDSRVATVVLDPSTSLLTVNALTVGTATLKIADALGAFYPITVVVDNVGGTGTGAAATIDILATSNTLNSAPGSTVGFIVTVKNSANAALPNQSVVFQSTSGTLTGANPAPVTNAAGTISTVSLSPGADASNRSIRVTATAGNATKYIEIPVVGTTVSVNGPGAAIVKSPAQTYTYTLKAADSSGRPIPFATLQITSDPLLNNTLSKSSVITDIAGSGTVDFTALHAGTDTLTVKWFDAENTAKVLVSAEDFAFVTTALTEPPWEVLPTTNPVKVRYLLSGLPPSPALRVDFSTTRGTLSPTFIDTDVNGYATVNVSSTTAGPVTVSARLTTAASKLASTSLTGAFVAKVPATLVLQVNPAALPPNAAGSTTNQSALTAIVRDAIGNLVKDAVVNFTVTDAGGGSLSQGSVTTDANGLATTQFIAGPSSTASNGVKLSATVQSTSPAVTGTASLTVNGSALFITIARSGTLDGSDSTTYKKDFTVYLTDATGAPAGNQSVTLSVWPTTYGKGTLTWDSAATPPVWKYSSGSPTTCANEDFNRNGILNYGMVSYNGSSYWGEDSNKNGVLDPGEDLNGNAILDSEDTNGNGKLEPGMPAVITPSVTTDALGFATFTLRYGKNFAWWVNTEITARALVAGTESKQIHTYLLEMTSTDALSSGSPANSGSPFGTQSVCTTPN